MQQDHALCCHVRHGTTVDCDTTPRPHDARRSNLASCPSAPSSAFQAIPSALVAPPRGPVCKLKVECDDQFFRSVSVKPHCALTAATISSASSSGPLSANTSAVASIPSITNPEMPASPHRRYSRSISHDNRFASIASSTPSPAARNSSCRLNSKTRRAKSIRRANDNLMIVNSTPGITSDARVNTLVYSTGIFDTNGSSEGDRDFVIGDSLCAAIVENPLLA